MNKLQTKWETWKERKPYTIQMMTRKECTTSYATTYQTLEMSANKEELKNKVEKISLHKHLEAKLTIYRQLQPSIHDAHK